MPKRLGSGSTDLSTPTLTRPPLTDVAGVSARVAQLSTAEKAKLLVMNYGDTHAAPWSGSIIVNQTHLTATGTKALKGVVGLASGRAGARVLVAADQEGGVVNRVKNVPGYAGVKFPSPKAMQGMTAAQLKAEGAKVGAALAAAGVNTLLGPVLDAAAVGTLMEKQGRSFGTTPDQVLARAQPFIDGLKQANPNLVILAKHFPGYDVRGNSDISRVDDPSTLEDRRARTTAFTQMKGLDGVMVNSVRYPNVDGQAACFSPKIIGLLREKNPDALVITDDIAAGGLMSDKASAYKLYQLEANGDAASKADAGRLLAKYPDFGTSAGRAAMRTQVHAEIKENAKKAFLAGCDVVLTMDSAEAPAVADAIAELIGERPELKPRLDAAAARMLTATVHASQDQAPAPAPVPAAGVAGRRGWSPA